MSRAPLRRRLRERLGYRVAFLLAVVLMPLTLISVIQSEAVLEESRARSEAALMGETMRAASGELRLIQLARGGATVLAEAIWPLVGHPEACKSLLRRLIEQQTQYSLIAYVPLNGISTCNSAGKTYSFENDPLFLRATTERRTSFATKEKGLVSGSSVLAITHPVFDETGIYRGMVSLSLPHSGLRFAEDSGTDNLSPLTMITYDEDGTVLTATRQLDDIDIAIPRDRALSMLTGNRAFSFSGLSAAGRPRVFSVVPLVPDELYALGSWPPEGASKTRGLFGSVPVLFPVLMWVASLVVAWLAVERLVIRHIRKLRRSILSFAGGNRIVGDIDVGSAPAEIREMAEAYKRMTETILHDEARLEDTLHQKEMLMREVHHRVKNNLQLIASIMNMQLRRTPSLEAKAIVRGLQDRVMSLATIHRELYQTAGLSDIHGDELLTTIVRQMANMAERPDRRFSIRTDFDDVRLTPDQAVPIALLVTEAVTNALKHSSHSATAPEDIFVALKRLSDTEAIIKVQNSHDPAPPAPDVASPRAGLGTQLLAEFARQLGGTVERKTESGRYELSVTFALRRLSDGEERNRTNEGG